jgi:hypothetical protein
LLLPDIRLPGGTTPNGTASGGEAGARVEAGGDVALSGQAVAQMSRHDREQNSDERYAHKQSGKKATTLSTHRLFAQQCLPHQPCTWRLFVLPLIQH